TFTSNGNHNTLIGGEGLDLFYGSRVRDTNDWNPNLGEVFVDPDGIQVGIKIDASALSGSYLALDYVYHDPAVPFSLNLAPGKHFLKTYGGDYVYVTVQDNGTVDYDAALEGILPGRGTNVLAVKGRTVQINASALSGSYLALDYAYHDSTVPFSAN